MHDDDESQPSAGTEEPDLSGFGLDSEEGEWMGRLRRVQERSPLGRFGEYDLLEVVGQGGQGVVYRARQVHTGRVVALKRLLTGAFATDAMRERFRREVEVDLALKHPYIVVVHDVQAIEDQPVVVMEWIDGQPLDRWATGRDGAAPEAVLGVFLKVCEGVHHAHQRGVIHRDLKPSNILVDGSGDPHVVDFGLARLTGSADHPSLTRSQGFVGTLAYAAPEQVRGDPDAADVRADVYALGCILYQSLTGRPPFEATQDLAALSHAVCHDEPARPSSVSRSADADVDAIIARAMAKGKERRYPSVEALAADVRRHLAHEPVEARRGNRWYVGRRLLRRYRAPAAVAGVLGLVLAGAAVVSTVMYLRAEQDRALSSAVYEFMHQVLTSVEARRDVTLEEALDKATHEVEGAFPGRPMVEADVRAMVGAMYENLGLFEKACVQAIPRAAILERELGPDDPKTLDVAMKIAWLLYRQHRYDESVNWARRAFDRCTRALGPDDAATIDAATVLGLSLNDSGHPEEAEPIHRAALAAAERTLGPDSGLTIAIVNNLAIVLASQDGKEEEAAALYRRALDALQRTSPADEEIERKIAITMFNLSALEEDDAERERLLRGAVEHAHNVFRAGHPVTVQFETALGGFLTNLGRTDESELILRAALDAAREHLGPDNPRTMHTQHTLGWLFTKRGEYQEAEDLILPAFEWSMAELGPAHSLTQAIGDALAKTYDAWGKADLAAACRARLAAESTAETPPPPGP